MHRAFAVALLIATPVLGPASSSAGDAGAVRTLHVATGGAHGADCALRTPCGTFDRAYRVARPGDTILIRGGTYPAQQIGVDLRKLNATRQVVFRVAKGQSALVDGELTMLGSHATFNGERRRDGSYSLRARRVVSVATSLATASRQVIFRDLKAETFAVTGTRSITFKGGDYGPNVACWPRGTTGTGPLGGEITAAMWCPVGSGYEGTGNTRGTSPRIGPNGAVTRSWPTNIILDGVTVHDQNSLDPFNMHSGGLFLVSGRGLRIENSVFYGNIVYDVFAQDFTTPTCCGMSYGPFRNVTIVRNRFRAPVNAALQAGGNGWTSRIENELPEIQLDPRNQRAWEDWRIARNSFDNGILFDGDPVFRNVSVAANIGGGANCYPRKAGFTWTRNAMSSSCPRVRIPWGYSQRRGALVPDPRAASSIRLVFSLAAAGNDSARIVRTLRRRSVVAPGRWTAPLVARILGERFYLGHAVGPQGAHPPLVTAAEWQRVQQRLRGG